MINSISALTEAQEELQAQILTRGVEEGRSLLDGVNGPLCATNSLAHELSQMSDDEVNFLQHNTRLLIVCSLHFDCDVHSDGTHIV